MAFVQGWVDHTTSEYLMWINFSIACRTNRALLLIIYVEMQPKVRVKINETSSHGTVIGIGLIDLAYDIYS